MNGKDTMKGGDTNTMKKGFTLIELLVVIAIIGILSAIGLVSLNGAREKARDAQAKSDLGQMKTALTLFADDHTGSYPGEATDGTPDASADSAGAGAVGTFWTNGGPMVPDYLQQALEAPVAGGHYLYLTNNDGNGLDADTCGSVDCWALYYMLETGTGDNIYAITEDGTVIDYGDDMDTVTCVDNGDCTFSA